MLGRSKQQSDNEGRATALIKLWGSMGPQRGRGKAPNQKSRAAAPTLTVIKSEDEARKQYQQQQCRMGEVWQEMDDNDVDDEEEHSNQESGVGNVQQLVLLFESKAVVGGARIGINRRDVGFSRPPSVCSGWSGVGRPHLAVSHRHRHSYDFKDTDSVSSVGSNSMWNRYERQRLWEQEGQSRLSGRGQACQVMATELTQKINNGKECNCEPKIRVK
eukprot:TRINITY_DN2642_c0_g3_i1.p2 TRINITY_DN2642_c0_g3~~TRINITY_DN2642_c0_g3_i1.p2  ORF type:complete len:217 (-),score=34.05 TRINITY_DN2642_c0_g3_i1:18-668(-)